MKIFSFITILIALNLSAQTFPSKSDSIKVGLNFKEMEIAKEKYIVMMQSGTSIEYNKKIQIFSEKLGDVEWIDAQTVAKMDKDSLQKMKLALLTDNIKRTSFQSLDEAVRIMKDIDDLSLKLFDENKELFMLISLATADQIGEIVEPDRKNRYLQN